MEAYLGLGSNLGNRHANLRMALRGLTRMAVVLDVSSLYETAPQGPPQPQFYNAACRISTGLEPPALLRFLQALEQEIGRRPSAEPNSPRVIDVDILLCDDLVIDTADLSVPHPRLPERPFVLVPLVEIAPDAIHPTLGKSIAQLAAETGRQGVSLIASRGWDGVAGAPHAVRL